MKERILIYGPPKVGISSFLAGIPTGKFIELGNGLSRHNIERVPVSSYEKIILFLNQRLQAVKEDDSQKYIIFDHLLGLEQVIFKHVCEKHPLSPDKKNSSIESIPYGKGYTLALELLSDLLALLDRVIAKKGVGVIIAAHATRVNYSTPFMENLTSYTPMISSTRKIGSRQEQTTFDILKVWMDAILFVEQQNFITGGFGKTDDFNLDDRVIFTKRKPWFEAGCRFDWPDTIPFKTEVFNSYLGLKENDPTKPD
jgi:hypothetical protein